MFIDIEMLAGQSITITAGSIIRFRPTFMEDEPAGATTLDYGGNRVYCAETPDSIIAKSGNALKVIKLTMPNGLSVHLDSKKVSQLQDANSAIHHPNAKCVLFVGGRLQQVRETRDEVKTVIEGVGGSASDVQMLSSLPPHFLE